LLPRRGSSSRLLGRARVLQLRRVGRPRTPRRRSRQQKIPIAGPRPSVEARTALLVELPPRPRRRGVVRIIARRRRPARSLSRTQARRRLVLL